MGDSFIEELSDQELEDYARSNQITSIVTYAAPETENDNETNSNSRAAGNTMVDFGDGSGGGGGESEPEYDTYTANGSYSSYSRGYSVEFVLVVLELGGGRYRCSLNATYADMPEDKYWDGIGIAVQECAYDGNASAWLKYDYNEKVLGSVTETGTISYDHFETAAMVADSGVSGWCGRGLQYQLWEDRWVGAITKVEYLNLRLHLEFECVVVHPDSATNFQVYVSYEHIYEKTEYSPSFGFDNAGTPSYSFSYAVDEISDTYVFSLENAIAYTS